MAKIGFIGLGHMGKPMAENLIKAGHQLTVFDLNQQVIDEVCQLGAQGATSLAQCANDMDTIITMLQTSEQVQSVCLSSDGLYANASSNTLHIDCSSIDVPSCRSLHHQAKEAGLIPLDAPVSGGVAGAEAGTLTFMVGADNEAFAQAQPLLQCMGGKIIHTGAAGTGQAAKICNNMILGISMAAISEAYTLAERLGLDAEKLYQVSSNSSGQCWAMTSYSPVPGLMDNVPSNNDYQPGFTAAMMLKDLKLSQQAARDAKLNTALGATAAELYQQFVEQGNADIDFSAIIKHIEQQ